MTMNEERQKFVMLPRNTGKLSKTKQELVLKGVDLVQRIEKLRHTRHPYSLKVITMKILNKELYDIKVQLERIEANEKK